MSFFGRMDGYPESSVQLVQHDGFIHGYIQRGTKQWRIETLDGQNYIFNVDQSHVPLEGCHDLDAGNLNPVDIDHEHHQHEHDMDLSHEEESEERINYDCKIRVLVMYTPAYAAATADPRGSIQGYMDYSNDGNNFSQVDEDLELCYVEEVNYTETSNMYTDRNRFRNDNDGFMDEVHDVRYIYEADLCHLLTNKSGHSGVAYKIDADNSSDAFCLTNKGNAESIYTFAHEMGHLIGCRHDPYVDNTNTPYAYGHGYIVMNQGSNNFRTIMSYPDQCSDQTPSQSCPRVLRWSTPDITYNGFACGTAATHKNERVWDVEDAEVIAFNNPDANETLDDPDVDGADYGYVTATSTISTTGNLTLDGVDFDMIAPTSITLGNGFRVSNGTYLFMDTKQNVTVCP